MRFSTAHGLLQVKYSLGGHPRETGDSFAKEVLHSLGYVRLLEKSGAIALGVNQIVQLLNLITKLNRQSVILNLTCVSYGFHNRLFSNRAFRRLPNTYGVIKTDG